MFNGPQAPSHSNPRHNRHAYEFLHFSSSYLGLDGATVAEVIRPDQAQDTRKWAASHASFPTQESYR